MNFTERAKMRIEHWIHHNASHGKAYDRFAAELEMSGKLESARQIRKVVLQIEQVNDLLGDALRGLGPN